MPERLFMITLHTSKGDYKFELYYKECPVTSKQFLIECAQDHYDGLKSKRNEPKFMIQFPTKTEIEAESEFGHKNMKGSLGLLKSGKSGIYICFAKVPELDGKRIVFGRCLGDVANLAKGGDEVTILSTTIHANPFA